MKLIEKHCILSYFQNIYVNDCEIYVFDILILTSNNLIIFIINFYSLSIVNKVKCYKAFDYTAYKHATSPYNLFHTCEYTQVFSLYI